MLNTLQKQTSSVCNDFYDLFVTTNLKQKDRKCSYELLLLHENENSMSQGWTKMRKELQPHISCIGSPDVLWRVVVFKLTEVAAYVGLTSTR